MNYYHNIPAELRQRMQWVVCDDSKAPRNPRTGALASISDPSTWGSFEEACSNGMKHIGFVFTDGDPYCGLDIDDKQESPANEPELANHRKILDLFQAYTEQSVGDRWFDDQGRERGGHHILIRGRVQHGRDFAHVGVYSHSRFFTFTGKVIRNSPIVDYQGLLDQLVAGMPNPGDTSALVQEDDDRTDAEIHEMACNALNGEKYRALCACTSCTGEGVHKIHGTYEAMGYPSQSHADFALLSIIAFYTRDNAQVRRIFRCTGLGQRDKAMRNDRYINTALAKIRAEEPKDIDLEALREDVARMFGQHADSEAMAQEMFGDDYSDDPELNAALKQDAAMLIAMGADPGPTMQDFGLAPLPPSASVGNLASFTGVPAIPTAPPPPSQSDMHAALVAHQAPAAPPAPPAPNAAPAAPVAATAPPVPTQEPAAWDLVPPGLVGAVAQYIYATAVRPVREVALAAAMGLVAGIAGRAFNVSGTGLNQYLLLVAGTGTGKEDGPKGVERLLSALRPMLPSIDDFVGPGAFASGQGLIRTLDTQPSVFSMLGEFGLTLQMLNDPRAPASTQLLKRALLDLYSKSGWHNVLRSTAYSDVEKNTKTVYAPALSFVGDTTPETFYGALSSSDIADGLLPRMTVIEYKGKRPNRNKRNGLPPEGQLLEHLASLAHSTLTMRNEHKNVPVAMDAEGQEIMDDYDHVCDERMRDDGSSVITRQLWNRAHLKALKVAALLAVGTNHHNPIVTREVAVWAMEFVERTTQTVLARFDQGDVGSGDGKMRNEVVRLIETYFKCTPKQLIAYRAKKEWRDAGVVPYSYMAMRASSLAAFSGGYSTSTQKLKETLDTMVAIEWLGQVPKQQATTKFGTAQALYCMGVGWPQQQVIGTKLLKLA